MPMKRKALSDLPPWVHMTPGPVGTIYCAVIAGVCSPPYSSASEAILWGQEHLDHPVIQVLEDVAAEAWGQSVVKALQRRAAA